MRYHLLYTQIRMLLSCIKIKECLEIRQKIMSLLWNLQGSHNYVVWSVSPSTLILVECPICLTGEVQLLDDELWGLLNKRTPLDRSHWPVQRILIHEIVETTVVLSPLHYVVTRLHPIIMKQVKEMKQVKKGKEGKEVKQGKEGKEGKEGKDRVSMRERKDQRRKIKRERRGARQSQSARRKRQAKREKKQRREKKKEKKNKQDIAPFPQQILDEEGDVDFNALQEDQPEQIQVSFLVAEIHEKYYHSMKTVFLKSSPLYQSTDAELADAAIKNVIGNVILADDEEQFSESVEQDEENVYSILTILPGRHQLTEKLKQIACKSIDPQSKLIPIISSQTTSLLLNERLPNLPAFVVESAHSVFKADLIKEKKKTPMYLLNVSQVQHQGSDKLQELIFSKFEDYEMCLRGEWWLGDGVKSHRKNANMRKLYYLIKFEDYLQGVSRLKTYLEQ